MAAAQTAGGGIMTTIDQADVFAAEWKLRQADEVSFQLKFKQPSELKRLGLFLCWNEDEGGWVLAPGPLGSEHLLIDNHPTVPVELYAPLHAIPWSHLAFAIHTATIRVPA